MAQRKDDESRSSASVSPLDITVSPSARSSSHGIRCGPHCIQCTRKIEEGSSGPIVTSTCDTCEFGYEKSTHSGRCVIKICQIPRCTLCTASQCLVCEEGYIWIDGQCQANYGYHYWTSSSSGTSSTSSSSDYSYSATRIILGTLIFLPWLLVIVFRSLVRRRRAASAEISMRTFQAPRIVVASVQSDLPLSTNADERPREEETESAPLLVSPGEDSGQGSGAVLVVDPMGNIGVGVQQGSDENKTEDGQ